MAWDDLTEKERAEVKADAWVFLIASCVALCGLAVWYFFVRTG